MGIRSVRWISCYSVTGFSIWVKSVRPIELFFAKNCFIVSKTQKEAEFFYSRRKMITTTIIDPLLTSSLSGCTEFDPSWASANDLLNHFSGSHVWNKVIRNRPIRLLSFRWIAFISIQMLSLGLISFEILMVAQFLTVNIMIFPKHFWNSSLAKIFYVLDFNCFMPIH